MDWDVFLDAFELDSLEDLRSGLEGISRFDRTVTGQEIINQLEGVITRNDANNCLYLLLDSGALTIEKPGLTIEKYAFIIDESNKTRLSSLIRRISTRIDLSDSSKGDEETVRFLVTLPPMIDEELPEDIGWIYPNIRMIIRNAKSCLDITIPYFDVLGTELLALEIAEATLRGVETRILCREILSKKPNQGIRYGLQRLVEIVRRHGNLSLFRIRDFHRARSADNPRYSSIHAKTIICDKNVAYVGSANITEYSLRSNFEIGVLVSGPQVESLSKVFNRIWDVSDFVSHDTICGFKS